MGIDLVSIDAVRESLAVHGERYVTRICTEREIAEGVGEGPRRLAERVAVKEAVMKLLRPGREPLPWTAIEVAGDGVRLTGPALELAQRAGIGEISVTVGCAGGYAQAVAVA